MEGADSVVGVGSGRRGKQGHSGGRVGAGCGVWDGWGELVAVNGRIFVTFWRKRIVCSSVDSWRGDGEGAGGVGRGRGAGE